MDNLVHVASAILVVGNIEELMALDDAMQVLQSETGGGARQNACDGGVIRQRRHRRQPTRTWSSW